jgi:hypothetical protein
MPGVNVTTATRSGPTAVVTAPSGQFFVAGQAARGATDVPTLLTGFADFEEYFGDRVTYSHLSDTVKTFFEEGGAKCYAVRVVGSDATKGYLELEDADAASDKTIKVEAANAGAWSDALEVVVAGTTTKTITINYDGEAKEVFTGTTVAELLENAAGSKWVTLTDLASTSTNKLPLNGTFNIGDDGTSGDDDRAGIVTADYTTALDVFDISLGDGAVAIPGVGTTVHATLIAHASANRRIALLDHSETASTANLITAADAVNSEYAVGYIAAVRNRAHVEAGPFRAAAGAISVARFVTGLKYDYNRTTGDSLDTSKVNAIRLINNSVRNYGWRSLSDDTDNYALLTGRDLLNRLVTESEKRLEAFVFQTIDGRGQLLSSINGTIVGIVEPYRQAGGLFEKFDIEGNLVDPGYLVETGSNVNTLDNLANNEVKARLSVRISPSAALITVTIVKVGLLAGL